MDNERDRDPQCVTHHQVILIFRIMASFEKVLLDSRSCAVSAAVGWALPTIPCRAQSSELCAR